MATDIAKQIINIAQNMEAKEKAIKIELLFVHYDFKISKYIDDKYAFTLENIDENKVKISYKSLSWIHYKKSKEVMELVIIILRQKITQMLRKNIIPCLNEHRVDVSIIHKEETIFTESITIMTPIEYEDLKLVNKYTCNNNIALLDLQTLYLTYFKLGMRSIHQTEDL